MTEEIICLHVVVVAFLVFFFWTIKGDLGHRVYRARMYPVWRWFLMPTEHDKTEAKWIHDQKVFVWFLLPLVALVYVMFLIAYRR